MNRQTSGNAAQRNDPELEKLGKLGFDLLQKLLAEDFSYLTPLIYNFQGESRKKTGALGTDGQTVYYDPAYLVKALGRGQEGYQTLKRSYMQMLCHCLLGHVWQEVEGEDALWDAACDLAADVFRRQITGEGGAGLGETDKRKLLNQLQWITPENLIALCSQDRKQRGRLLRLSERTRRDSHTDWPGKKKKGNEAGLTGREGNKADSAAENGQTAAKHWRDLLQMAYGMMPDQMADAVRRGMELAGFEQSLSAAEENQSDYRKLLRKYAKMKERKMEDFDSFDYSWYSLGMELYGNIPLIEFPESSEKPTVDEIVIGVDVSGSCGGDVAARFLRETCNMIRDIGVGTEEADLRILECDTKIQRETVIRREEDIPDFETRVVRGFGGTSFVPVFERIQELREQGGLRGPRCLLYLSDGFGTFPEAPPPYDVIFVLTEDDGWGREHIPDWVQTVYLTEHDLKEEQP